MTFADHLAKLALRIPSILNHLETEEATKNALVMPFIAAWGYDIFDPQEVIPEYTADVGTKKGEKVDYAIFREGEIIMIIECKKVGTSLHTDEINQLFRYFHTSTARIGVLTDGIRYRFFTDMQESNKMDSRPFLELELTNLRKDLVKEVAKLGKEHFNLEKMLSTASELKFTSEIKKELLQQMEDPDLEFVKFFFQKSNPDSQFRKKVQTYYSALVKRALNQFIRERVSIRLRTALEQENTIKDERDAASGEKPGKPEENFKSGVVTTEEEIEGFHIVRAIVREVIAVHRINHRDTKGYMGILVDDNNRKPVCRLRFNREQKYLGLFDEEKNETSVPIESLDDLFGYADQLQISAKRYE